MAQLIRKRIVTIFGTRPEIIKLAPVLHEMEKAPDRFETITISTGQHADLLRTFIPHLRVRVDRDLNVMLPGQTPNQLCARILSAIDPVLLELKPDFVLVQGDTTTAFSGALAAFHHQIPVGHVEAGLRTWNPTSPFPEEMNRRLLSQLASFHFAATTRNRDTLLAEGVRPGRVFVTGNPVVDSVRSIQERLELSPLVQQLLDDTRGQKRIVLTTHRRENFGGVMTAYLEVLRAFIERHEDLVLFFPVHPNPVVRAQAKTSLSEHPRIHLLDPLDYMDFIGLLSAAWLIVSDSGGIQEEAPTLGKPLLVLRESTERPEAIESGVARLVGTDARRLDGVLEHSYQDAEWVERVKQIDNPFGRGDSGKRIAAIISEVLETG